jgi:hypothetical protein
MDTRNLEWKIEPRPDGSYPTECITHALLIDIRETTRSMRKMVVFFTVLGVINCMGLLLWALIKGLS